MYSTLTTKQQLAHQKSAVQRKGFRLSIEQNKRYKHLLQHMQSEDIESLRRLSNIQVLCIGCDFMAPELCALKALLPQTKITCIAIDIDPDIIDANQTIYQRDDAKKFFAGDTVKFIACDIQHYTPDSKFDLILWTGIELSLCSEPPISQKPENTTHIFGQNSINYITRKLISQYLFARGVFFLETSDREFLQIALSPLEPHGQTLINKMTETTSSKRNTTVSCTLAGALQKIAGYRGLLAVRASPFPWLAASATLLFLVHNPT